MTTPTEELRALYDEKMVPTYNFTMPIIVKGEGAYVEDIDGKRYLDFTTGISVCSLGHCHPAVVSAITRQASTLMHCSNVFCNNVTPRLAQALSAITFGGKAFFCNSGAEANEGLVKAARLWGNKNGGRSRILTFQQSFHGRTLATLAATGQPKFRAGMEPEMQGFIYAPYNDLAAVKEALTDDTCAILVEPVQGEGGVYPATQEFMKGLRALCTERNMKLLVDEVQTGVGRTCEFFGYQHYGITPDGLSTAKALGNGIPLGAFLLSDELSAQFTPGLTHGSTFGGNPLATAAGLAVIGELRKPETFQNARRASELLFRGLKHLQGKHACVKEIRGLGLIIGIEITGDGVLADSVKRCRENGLLVLTAGGNTMRLLPSLLSTEEQIAEALNIIDGALP